MVDFEIHLNNQD